jgi:hypothetical protein
MRMMYIKIHIYLDKLTFKRLKLRKPGRRLIMLDLFKDRRSSKRLESNVEAEYKVLDDSADVIEMGYRKAKAKNISLGGLCMLTGIKLEAGNVIRVDLPLGRDGKKVNAFCEVEWCRRDQDAWLAGFSFITLGEEETQNLGEFIKTYN